MHVYDLTLVRKVLHNTNTEYEFKSVIYYSHTISLLCTICALKLCNAQSGGHNMLMWKFLVDSIKSLSACSI